MKVTGYVLSLEFAQTKISLYYAITLGRRDCYFGE